MNGYQTENLGKGPPTVALVQLNVAWVAPGESWKDDMAFPRNRRDIVQALQEVASLAQREEGLLAAEVIWAPEQPYEVWTKQDFIADFPELIPF